MIVDEDKYQTEEFEWPVEKTKLYYSTIGS